MRAVKLRTLASSEIQKHLCLLVSRGVPHYVRMKELGFPSKSPSDPQDAALWTEYQLVWQYDLPSLGEVQEYVTLVREKERRKSKGRWRLPST